MLENQDSEPNRSGDFSTIGLKKSLLPSLPHEWVDKAEYIEDEIESIHKKSKSFNSQIKSLKSCIFNETKKSWILKAQCHQAFIFWMKKSYPRSLIAKTQWWK